MKGYVFPGQGAQYPGMGKDIYDKSSEAKKMFHQANEILNFDITSIMFGEDAEKLKPHSEFWTIWKPFAAKFSGFWTYRNRYLIR